MILPDVNVLIYAFRADSPQHDRYAGWLESYAAGGQNLALCDTVVTGFLRIVTNSKILSPAATIEQAVDFLAWLKESPGTHWLTTSPAVWQEFRRISANDRGVRGNLVPDAFLAALCIAHGATIATADRDFARFDGLQRTDPGAP